MSPLISPFSRSVAALAVLSLASFTAVADRASVDGVLTGLVRGQADRRPAEPGVRRQSIGLSIDYVRHFALGRRIRGHMHAAMPLRWSAVRVAGR